MPQSFMEMFAICPEERAASIHVHAAIQHGGVEAEERKNYCFLHNVVEILEKERRREVENWMEILVGVVSGSR